MSTFIIHLLIPLLLALAVGVFKPRDAWAWSWMAVVQDLDYTFWITHVNLGWANFHRALFHNVWILLGLVAWSAHRYAAFRKTLGGPSQLAAFVQVHAGFVLAPFYFATHLVLDAFQGGFVPFWPASNLTVFWDFALTVNTATQRPEIESNVGTYVGVPVVSTTYTWLTGEEFAYLLLFLATLLLGQLYQRRARTEAAQTTLRTQSEPTTLL